MSQMQPNRPAYQQLVGKQQVCKSVQGNRIEGVPKPHLSMRAPDLPDQGYA
jgi:hypothetical protein